MNIMTAFIKKKKQWLFELLNTDQNNSQNYAIIDQINLNEYQKQSFAFIYTFADILHLF